MLPHVMDQLDHAFTAHRPWEAADRDAFIRDIGPSIRGIATGGGHTQIDGAFLDRLPNLEIVANFGVGYDNIDAAEAARRGVMVTHTPDVLSDEVADLTIGLLLATLRQIPQADRYLRAGKWTERPFALSPTLRNRKIGIMGLGRIGKAIANRLVPFGVEISYFGRTRKADVDFRFYSDLVAMAAAVDVLVVVTPGGVETTHLVNAEVLAALGPEGVLINVARGSVVDEQSLIRALADKTILGAGLDVYEHEPEVPAELIAMEHVVLLPHIGSASAETRRAMGQLVVDNLITWFSGKGPLTPVRETPWPR
nr:2-hydroxyacid dehydrogenase [Faunimonas pinastri]